MNAKDKEFYDIVFKNCTEEEIYAILLKKKEIDDKTPKLRTEDENKTLRFLFNKMRKFPKDLIAEIKNKCPSLQRKPKTAEQRKEQKRIIEHNKRSEESEIDKEMRLTKDKITKHKRYKREPTFMGPLQVWPMVCGSRGSKNVTYRQQTTDKKVNTEPL